MEYLVSNGADINIQDKNGVIKKFRCYEAKTVESEKAGSLNLSCTCAVHIKELWGLVDVRLLWLSGRTLAAQARAVLSLTPSDDRPFHFPLLLPYNI